ncbi:MAG: cell division protein FtsZ [Alphaproteobacteria bacterium]|nr:cell division protein FtsZ [Alphaproteobacteria bacterium]
MTLTLSTPSVDRELKPRIVVVGVGGAGSNAVNNMIAENLEGVEFVVANTDAQALALARAERRIQLGVTITHGLGAGARPDIGRAAAEEALDDIVDHLQGAHMAFIAAGMGGGTGTGAAPVVARVAREQGILTVGVVTKPFSFEGNHRMRMAEEGIAELQNFVDTLIVIPNQNLFRICNEKTTFAQAFQMADNVLHQGVRGVTDLMVMPGLINLDFADIRTVMGEMGKAMMGTGEAGGERRALEAAEAAIANPLLDEVSMQGARGVLINVTGGPDMTLYEVDEAANRIRQEVDPEAHIIFGATFDEKLEGIMRVSIVATGIEAMAQTNPRPAISLVHNADPDRARRVAEARPAGSPAPRGGVVATVGANAMAIQHPIPSYAAVAAPVGNASAAMAAVADHMPAVTAEPATEAPASEPVTEAGTVPLAEQPATEQTIATAEVPFIAPPPVMPAREPVAPLRANNPFDEAALVNTAPRPERKRGRSLFQRATAAVSGLVGDDAAPRPTAKAEPTVRRQAPPLPTPPAAPAAPLAEPVAQRELVNLDRPRTPSTGAADEDQLEIPAFLRRRTN